MPTIRAIHTDTPGLTAAESTAVFDHIAQFASYGFNKSHAAAYAAIGFDTAWLKRHHPESLFSAAMNLSIGDIKELAVFAGQLKARNIPILPPHVNQCGARFAPIQGNTRLGVAYGLAALRGVGLQAAQAVEDERVANGHYTSMTDFKTRVGTRIGKRAMVSLVQAGALNGLVESRCDGVALAEERAGATHANQMSLFDTAPGVDTRVALPEWDRGTLLDREFDSLGFWLSGHPLDTFRPTYGARPLGFVGALRGRETLPRQAQIVASVIDWDTRGTKSGGVMAILTLSDPNETFEAVAFDDEWIAIRSAIAKKATLVLTVQPSADGPDLRLTVTDAGPYTLRAQRAA